MTDSAQGNAAAILARTKRIEIQHFADGGTVRRTTVKNFAKPNGAAAQLAQVPASHANAKAMQHGGAVHGPGGPTSDSVPLWGSAGEFMLPADTTAAVGKENLQALVDATHTPTNKAAQKMRRLARADGGLINPQLGAVTRVGNSYSGGNVSGSITVNGQAPGGTVSTVDAFRAPPPPAAPPVLGMPASQVPIAPKPAAAALATPPTATPAPPAPASPPAPAALDYANRNAAFNAGAMSRTTDLQSGRARASGPATAAPPAGSAAAALAARPVQSIVGYADGGEIEDPTKKRVIDAAGQLGAVPPGFTTVPPPGAPGASQIPTGKELYPIAAPAPVASAAPALAPSPAPSPAPAAAESAAAPVAAQSQLASMPASDGAPARPNPLGSLADTNAQLASLQASNAAVTQGGATIIDGAAAEADRRAQFNEQANLRNALNSTVMTRRGAVPNEVAVQAALLPIDARARMAQIAAKEAGDTQRATIQERGADARARLADTRAQQELGINQQRLALEGKKVVLDASRDDRQAAAALAEQARKGRIAQLDELILSGSPSQQKAAAAQKAALMGKGLDEAGKTGEVSTAIRKEFEGLPEVKNYKQALPSYRGIEDAVKRNTPMSDINIVYGIAKLYDPNSVVREGEYSTVANAPGMPERVKGWVQYVAGGGKLTSEVKKQILTEAQSRMNTFDTEYSAARDRYADIAKRSSADPSLVVPQNYKPAVAAPPTAPARPTPGTSEGGWTFTGGDPADRRNWRKS